MTMFEIVAMGTSVAIHLRHHPGSNWWRLWIVTHDEFTRLPWLHYQTKLLRQWFFEHPPAVC